MSRFWIALTLALAARPGETLSALVADVDRAVHAFDALDGRKLWSLARPGDALTLSQAGVVTAATHRLVLRQPPYQPRLRLGPEPRGRLAQQPALRGCRGP